MLTNQTGRAIVDGVTVNEIRYQLQDAIARFKTEPYLRFALIVSGDSLLRISSTDLIYLFLWR